MQRTVKRGVEIYVYSSQANCRTMDIDFGIQKAYSKLLESALHADCEITVGEQVVKAHKCLLTARSEKFYAMLVSEGTVDMKESSTSKVKI